MPTQRSWLCLAALALLTACPTDDDGDADAGSSTASTSGSSSGTTTDAASTAGPPTGGSTDGSTSDGSTTDAETDTDAATGTDTDGSADTGSTGEAGCGMPVELATANLGDLELDGFHVVGTTMAAALRGDGVGLLDVSDPSAVTVLGTFDPDGGPTYRAAFADGFIVGGRRGGGAFMVDAADPAAMVELWVDDQLDTEDVVYEGDRLYLASSAGLSVVDVSTPDMPTTLVEDLQQDSNGLNIGGSTVAKTGDVLAMAGFNFTTIDVSTPDTPVTLAEVDDTGRPDNLVIGGSYIYVGGNDGVQIFDLTDPAAPMLVGTYPGERATLLALDDDNDRLYVFGSSTTSNQVPLLRIVDVADKANPVELGSMYDELDDPLWAQFEAGVLYFTTDATDPPSLIMLDGCPPA
ncbi:MAG: hypothetical protein AAGA54_19690 [Myxococcota bacterium]